MLGMHAATPNTPPQAGCKHLVFTWRVYKMSIQVSKYRWKTGKKDGGTKVSMAHRTVEEGLKCSCIKRSCMSKITFASLYHVHLLHCLRHWAVRYVAMYTPNHGNIDGKVNKNVHIVLYCLLFQFTVCSCSGNLSFGKTSLDIEMLSNTLA